MESGGILLLLEHMGLNCLQSVAGHETEQIYFLVNNQRAGRMVLRCKANIKKPPKRVTLSSFLASTPSKRSRSPERMIIKPAATQSSLIIKTEAIRVAKKPMIVKELGLPLCSEDFAKDRVEPRVKPTADFISDHLLLPQDGS